MPKKFYWQKEKAMAKNDKPLISISAGNQKTIVSSSGPKISIAGKQVNLSGKSRSVDLVFVIDTTGSMSDKIDGLLATCSHFVEEFAKLGLDYKIAVVAFGDLTVPGDTIEATDFTDQIEVIKKSLVNVPRNSGGGNEGESSLEALDKALALKFRQNAVKTFILITDEPALQQQTTAKEMTHRLQLNEALVFVISPPLSYFQEMATQCAGKWYQVSATTDFTDLTEMFANVAQATTATVQRVFEIGDGSVSKFRRLKPPGS